MMDVMEARRTKITPSSGHPGESRDPGGNAARLVTCAEDYVRPLAKSPYEASPSWIPDQVRDDVRKVQSHNDTSRVPTHFIQPAK